MEGINIIEQINCHTLEVLKLQLALILIFKIQSIAYYRKKSYSLILYFYRYQHHELDVKYQAGRIETFVISTVGMLTKSVIQ